MSFLLGDFLLQFFNIRGLRSSTIANLHLIQLLLQLLDRDVIALTQLPLFRRFRLRLVQNRLQLQKNTKPKCNHEFEMCAFVTSLYLSLGLVSLAQFLSQVLTLHALFVQLFFLLAHLSRQLRLLLTHFR